MNFVADKPTKVAYRKSGKDYSGGISKGGDEQGVAPFEEVELKAGESLQLDLEGGDELIHAKAITPVADIPDNLAGREGADGA